MSSSTDDGGPAYLPAMVIAGGENNSINVPEGAGFSVRDEFAARAMQGLIPKHDSRYETHTELCRAAYRYADGMMIARKRRSSES